MPQLIKNIQGEAYMIATGSINTLTPVAGLIQQEDYINLNGFIAYLQNFTKAEYTKLLLNPMIYGLKQRNRRVEIQISY